MARAFDRHRSAGAIAALCVADVRPDSRKLVETALSADIEEDKSNDLIGREVISRLGGECRIPPIDCL